MTESNDIIDGGIPPFTGAAEGEDGMRRFWDDSAGLYGDPERTAREYDDLVERIGSAGIVMSGTKAGLSSSILPI